MNIKKIILKEIDEFEWIKNVPSKEPIELGDGSVVYVGDDVMNKRGNRFTIEELAGEDGDFPEWVWGSGLPNAYIGNTNKKNFHNPHYLLPV